MEASVAIIQLRQSALSDRKTSSPHDYDVIILDEPSKPSTSYAIPRGGDNQSYVTKRSTVGSHTVGSTVISLPTFKISQSEASLSEIVLEQLATKTRCQHRRAVAVPLFDDRPNNRQLEIQPGTALMCVPVLPKDRAQYPYGRQENLARLVHMCLNTPESLDVQTRHMLLRIDEWLAHSQRVNPHFLASLFVCPPSRSRVLRCAHNPAYVGEDYDRCIRYVHRSIAGSGRSVCSSIDLDEKVRIGNLARVEMMTYDKYNTFVMNPFFGWMPYNEDQAPPYFAVGSKSQRAVSRTSQKSAEFAGQFPLHRAAYVGDEQAIELLISRGCDVNERDRDSWTALHYSCFYQHHKSTAALLTTGNADVNIQNKGGATPLHFASLNGNAFLVELLLSHPSLDLEIRNNDGLRAVDLCENVPRKEWQDVAKLLRDWKKIDKIQIDFLNAGSAMALLVNGDETTVHRVLKQIGAEFEIDRGSQAIFAIWICSDSLALQLKPDHKVNAQLNVKKWRQNLGKWTDNEDSKEKPHLVMKRNAHATLSMEQAVKLNDFSRSLLYDEARSHFLLGHFPCNDKTTVHLASIVARILYGNGAKLSDKSDLALILPPHLLLRERPADWRSKINKFIKDARPCSISYLQQEFLTICRQFKIYGSTFFSAEVYMSKPHVSQQRVLCGVNDFGLHVISLPNHALAASYDHRELKIVFTSGNDHLELVARAHEHQMTIRTRQAAHIVMLLNRLGGLDGDTVSRTSSAK